MMYRSEQLINAAQQTGPRGEALGNFPQAFTHLALISAAFNLDPMLGSYNGTMRVLP
jgi:GH15 family glucan-1,4-alpha-glucosidase